MKLISFSKEDFKNIEIWDLLIELAIESNNIDVIKQAYEEEIITIKAEIFL